MVYAAQIQRRGSRTLLTNCQHPLLFLAVAIPQFIYIKFYHQANNHSKYADALYHCMINDKDSHIPSPLIMFACTTLRHALLERQKNKGVHPKASKSKLQVDRSDRSKNINYNNDGGKNRSCCGAQVANLAWGCRHVYILDEYQEHTTGEIPTEGVLKLTCYSQASYPTGGEPNAYRGDQYGSSEY